MDYVLIFAIWLLGVGFDVMSKVAKLRKKFPDFKQVFPLFFSEEWDSLIVSGLVLLLLELALFILRYNEVVLPAWIENWGMYAIGLVFSYSGQRIAYKYLGTSEGVLIDWAEKKKQQIEGKDA